MLKMLQSEEHSSSFNTIVPYTLLNAALYGSALQTYYSGSLDTRSPGTFSDCSLVVIVLMVAMGAFENGFWLDVVLESRNLRLVDVALIILGFASVVKLSVHFKESVTLGLE